MPVFKPAPFGAGAGLGFGLESAGFGACCGLGICVPGLPACGAVGACPVLGAGATGDGAVGCFTQVRRAWIVRAH